MSGAGHRSASKTDRAGFDSLTACMVYKSGMIFKSGNTEIKLVSVDHENKVCRAIVTKCDDLGGAARITHIGWPTAKITFEDLSKCTLIEDRPR